MITVTIIAALVFVGATALRTNDTQATRNAGFDVVDLMRRARYVAARQNVAVVVQVVPYGQALAGGDVTRGLLQAYLGADTRCPQSVTPTSEVIGTVDFGLVDPDDGNAAGIAVVQPNLDTLIGQDPTDGFCIRPNGRILANATGNPIPPTSSDPAEMSGKADLYIQWDPVRLEGSALVVPVVHVEVPFNGLVRIPQ